MGVDRYSTKSAIETACGARISDQLTANFGASVLPGGSESYLLGDMPAVAFRTGISFKFGKSYASSSANKISALNNESYNSLQLSEAQREASKAQRGVAEAQREVDGLRNKVASLEFFKAAEVAEMKSLKAEVAELKSLTAEVAAMKVMMAGLLGNRVVAMR